MSRFIRPTLAGLAIAAALALSPASAETASLRADLKGIGQVMPSNAKVTGSVAVTYDSATKTLSWKGSVSGLSGEVTATHFHGPAEPGRDAPVLVPAPGVKVGDFEGSAAITDRQAKIILDGKSYFNIHTAANPNGEARGQVVQAK
jgi:hypothetical protein